MRPRPVSITVIGWFLIVSGALTFPGAFGREEDPRVEQLLARRPVPVAVQQGMLLAGAVANLVSGYFLLRGQNWARHLYIAWTLVQLGYAWLAAPFRLVIVPGAMFFLLVVFFLFRPAANAFFAGEGLVDAVSGATPPRRMFAIGCQVLAGFFFVCSAFAAFFDLAAGEKALTLTVMLLPALGFLAIGRMAWRVGPWKRDVGVVLAAAAVVSVFMAVSIALMLIDPGFRELMPPEHLNDYGAGIGWIVAMGAVGAGMLYAEREGS